VDLVILSLTSRDDVLNNWGSNESPLLGTRARRRVEI
jgi:hypothetical protein